MRTPLCSALKQQLQLVAGLECSRERSGATGTDESQRSCMLQQVGQQRGQAGQIRSKEGGGHTGTKEQTGVRCECGQGHKQAEVGHCDVAASQHDDARRSWCTGECMPCSGGLHGRRKQPVLLLLVLALRLQQRDKVGKELLQRLTRQLLDLSRCYGSDIAGNGQDRRGWERRAGV
ncbi:unnamed protein product [Closterium sp. NIES-54]